MIYVKSGVAHGSDNTRMSQKPFDIGEVVHHLPLFAALTPGELRAIAHDAVLVDAPRKTVLYRRGDPSAGFHVVLLGQVKLSVERDGGNEKVLDIINPLQSFGEAAMFLGEPHVVTAQAIEETKLLFLPGEAALSRIDANPRFARTLLARLSARLHRLMADVESYALQSGTERVARYLTSIVASGHNGEHRATLCASKGVIASRLNLTQEHFSRILHGLASAGLIAVNGREVAIPDINRLQTVMHGTAEACS